MIACNQKKCEHLARQDGETVCTLKDPRFYRLIDSRSFILKCGAYHRRTDWTADGMAPVRALVEKRVFAVEDEDGLWPGQLKAPIDYSDIDPDEVSGNQQTEHEEAECST